MLVWQDEIWSEIVLKRLRSVRERTKEGLFGNVPYSFMTSSLRTRYTGMFSLYLLNQSCWPVGSMQMGIFAITLLCHELMPKLYYIFFGLIQTKTPSGTFVLNLFRFNTNLY